MNPSWDEGSTSMASIDLLSSPTASMDAVSPSRSNLEQIEEVTNNSHEHHEETCGTESLPQQPQLQQNNATAGGDDNKSVIYQLDFDVDHLGKNKPSSKRMAMWKYGLSSSNTNSATSIAGHEAKLIWSTHSGKYTISVDGLEIYNNIAKGSVLEHKWLWSHDKGCVVENNDNDNNSIIPMRIIACRKPPTRSSKDFRCYEFVIGGRVFRDLPSVVVTDNNHGSRGGEFENEESAAYYAANDNNDDGKLMSILDVIEPGWRATGFA